MEPRTALPTSAAPPRRRVAVAMSGGVDSSVAAALLAEQGYEVVGVHMKLHDGPEEERRDKSCCSLDDALDARQACARLGIPFYVLDLVAPFRERVIDYFVAGYRAGLTPNPCVMCNTAIKNAALLERVREFGCDALATGHYARVRPDGAGGHQLVRPRDRDKDQTYFLFGTPREALGHILFPLADYEKGEVRALAERHGFLTWNKPDSQEVCFVPRDTRSFLAGELAARPPLPGDFVDTAGRVLGTHRGLPYYTVGQRRGLGLGGGPPLYVVALRPGRNQVVLGADEALLGTAMTVRGVNWVSRDPITGPIAARVQVRYAHAGTPARVLPLDGEGPGAEGSQESRVRVEFEAPVRAITPGQAAVFYAGEVLLGGGWIEPADDPDGR